MSQEVNLAIVTGGIGPVGPTGATGPAGATGAGGGGGGGGGSAAGFSAFEEFLSSAPNADGNPLGAEEAWFYGGALDLWVNRNHALTIFSAQYDNQHPGCIYLRTGTATDGYTAITQGGPTIPDCVMIGGGVVTFECCINTEYPASDGTETYMIRAGIMHSVDDSTPADGLWFEAVSGVNSRKWVTYATGSSSLANKIDSTVTAPASSGDWAKLKIVANAGGTSVEFFIDDVSIGSLSGDIPADYNGIGICIGIYKRAGTTERKLLLDYASLSKVLTTSR